MSSRSRSVWTATVDLPEPDRPVNHTVAPPNSVAANRSVRATSPGCQTTLGLVRSVTCGTTSGASLRGPDDHPGRHRLARRFVDQHEAPGVAVAPILVEEQRGRGPH